MSRVLALAAALAAVLPALPRASAQDEMPEGGIPIPLPPPMEDNDAPPARGPGHDHEPGREAPQSPTPAVPGASSQAEANPGAAAPAKPGEPPKSPASAPAPAPKPAAPAEEPIRIDPPPGRTASPAPDARIKFQFKEATIESLLKYVSEQLGVTFIKEAKEKIEGTVTAVSTEGVPPGEVLAFLDSVLKPKGLTTLRFGEIVKIVDVDEAKRRNIQIFVGSDPDQVKLSDTIITQVIPLKNAVATEILKELTNVASKTGELAANARSNTLVLTDTSASVHRFVKIIKELDRQLTEAARIRIYFLKHADAQSVTAVLNEIFGKNDSSRSRSGMMNPWQMFFGQGGGDRGNRERGGPSSQDPTPRTTIQIASDQRTNSVIAITSDEYHALIQEVIDRLDVQMADLLQVKVYMLQHADATDTVRIIKEILPETSSSGTAAATRGGGRGGSPQERFARMFQPRATPETRQGGMLPNQNLDVTADPRTNSVIVVASKEYQILVKEIIEGLDSQISGLMKVRVYRLQNADAVETADIINRTFVQGALRRATTSRSGLAGGSGALPSDSFDVTADARTNTLIFRATEDNLRELDLLVKALDNDPTEASSTIVVPLRNASADNVATVLQQLLRSTGGGGSAASTAGRTATGASTTRTNASRTGTSSSGTRTGGSSSLGGSTGSFSRMAPGGDPDEEPPEPVPAPRLAPGAPAPTDSAVEDPDAEKRSAAGPGGVSGQVDVRADSESNAVLIRTAPRNLDAVRKLIAELDQVRQQVLIKVLIAEVTLDDTLRFGVQGYWENGWRVNGEMQDQRFGTNFGADFSVVQPSGSGFLYRLAGDEVDLRLQALNKDGRLKVLSTPRILALHNEMASINVGKDIPEVVSTRYDNNGNQINTIQRRDIGIILQVTPRINPDGLVTMTVHPEVSTLAPNSESVEIQPGVYSPVINRNYADTTVAVPHGKTVVIGGLIREIENTTVNKIPILGDIPLLGYLFRTDEILKQQAELMIFLTPFVVNDAEGLREMSRLEQAQLKMITSGDVKRHVPDWEFEPRE